MSPSDLFHLFCAGLQKALLSWILIIITIISKADNKVFADGPKEFDANVCQLGRLPEMPHVASNVAFYKGIISIIEGKSKQEMASGSASFGGKFRSAEYTNALLLSFLAVRSSVTFTSLVIVFFLLLSIKHTHVRVNLLRSMRTCSQRMRTLPTLSRTKSRRRCTRLIVAMSRQK